MMAMGATRLGGKTHDDHVRTELADDTHDIGQHLLFVPDAQRFAIILGITEVNRPGEKLAAAIETAGGKQFLGAGHAQFLAEFRTQHVLTAVTARQREIGGAIIPSPGQIGYQQGVFVVGMRRKVEHAAHFAEALQLLQNG